MRTHVHLVTYKGITSRFHVAAPDDLIQRNIVEGHFFDVDDLEDLLAYIHPGTTVLDIGANVGNHTIFFAVHVEDSRVVPFEVNPAACALLRANVHENGLHQVDLTWLGVGLSRQRGRIFLVHSRVDNLGATAFSAEPPSAEDEPPSSFECSPLDDLLPEKLTPGFVKMDVEGMELDVLEGSTQIFDRWRPTLFIESFGWVAGLRLLMWMVERNYRLEKLVGPNYIMVALPAGVAYPPGCRSGIRNWTSNVVATGSGRYALAELASWQNMYGCASGWLSHAAAEIFLKLGDVHGAASAISETWRASDACVGQCQTAAEIAKRLGDERLRLEVLQRAATLSGFDANLAHDLSEALYASGRTHDAYAAICTFLANHPDSARAHHTASVMAERLGDLRAAIMHSTRVVDLAPPNATSHMVRLADLLRVSGHVEDACAMLDRAEALGQRSEWASQVRVAINQALANRRFMR